MRECPNNWPTFERCTRRRSDVCLGATARQRKPYVHNSYGFMRWLPIWMIESRIYSRVVRVCVCDLLLLSLSISSLLQCSVVRCCRLHVTLPSLSGCAFMAFRRSLYVRIDPFVRSQIVQICQFCRLLVCDLIYLSATIFFMRFGCNAKINVQAFLNSIWVKYSV